ncbi:MAG: hypothetical protein IPK83_00260 [Planctomycetes bacterium]|nr:hypothetical protein [Planctomycetota bacterium]
MARKATPAAIGVYESRGSLNHGSTFRIQLTTGTGNDIFTILIISAFVIVAATLGYAIFKCTELLGIPFPIFAS